MNYRNTTLCAVLIFGVIMLVSPLSARADLEPYMIDQVHSMANFKIRHLFSKVSGTFSEVTGKIWVDRDNLEASRVEATISVYSIDTNHEERDTDLLSSNFFDAEKYRIIRFASTTVEATGKDRGVMHGNLTMHGVTRSVKVVFNVLGFGPDPWGGYRSGFEASTVLKRSEYGMTYALGEQGGGLIGDKVDVTLLIEAIKLGPDGSPYKGQ